MIIIQSNSERTLAHHFDASCALYGAIENCEDYRLTSFEEVQSGKLNNLLRQNLAVGSTEFMREVFKQLGKEDVRLPRNSDRPVEIITLKEAHDRVAAGEKLFIKPYEIKLFTGLVLDGMKYSCLNGLPDDTKVMAYKPFEHRIATEWRYYIHRGQIVDARNYSGNFLVMPSGLDVYSVLSENKELKFPVAYTMDFAVLDDGPINYETVVVEFNDMWAIGNYGVPNDLYLRMLKDRYFEIIRG
jgi:hypothetical protein